jgi:hypothetical protein
MGSINNLLQFHFGDFLGIIWRTESSLRVRSVFDLQLVSHFKAINLARLQQNRRQQLHFIIELIPCQRVRVERDMKNLYKTPWQRH